MKRKLHIIAGLTILVLFAMSPASHAQSRKERRAARREARALLESVRDSLGVKSFADEEVNVGYGRVKRHNLTTSVSKVAIQDDVIGSYSNICEYLMGRVPGLQVTKVGSEYKYTIRGINSINSPTDPLFLVNGVETVDINYLNPRDIQSVEVLKDASASIYGTRGACGVILITTK